MLLQLRQHTGYMDDHWAAAAAGHVEKDETAYDAAAREAREELGITGVALEFLASMQRTQGGDPIDERVDFFFAASSWTGEPRIMEPDKCAALRWFPLSALPHPVVPHELAVLTALHEGVVPGYLTFGFGGTGGAVSERTPEERDIRESSPNAGGPDDLTGGMGVSSERVGHAGPGQEGATGVRDTSEAPGDDEAAEGDVPPEQRPGAVEENPVGIPPKAGYPTADPRHEDTNLDR